MGMKKMIAAAAAAVLALSLTACSNFKTDKDEYYGGVCIDGYTGTNNEIVTIPSEVGGKTVTSIYMSAFEGHSEIQTIEIPGSVKMVYGLAKGCTNFTEFKVSNDNDQLRSVDGILYDLFNGSIGACEVCPIGKKGDVVILNGVSSIYDSAFENCTGVTSVAIPNDLFSVGQKAFKGCSGLKAITFGDKYSTGIAIEYAAFADCTGLTEVTLPDKARVRRNAFTGCENINVTYKGNTYDYDHINDLYNLFDQS